MSTLSKRTTIYLDPQLHQALRYKSAETTLSISQLINDMIRESLREDAEDLAAFREREHETPISFEDFVQALKEDGKL